MSSSSASPSDILILSTWIKSPEQQRSSITYIQGIQKAAQTLFAICNNILQNPFNEKFRRVRILSPQQQSSNTQGKFQYSAPIQHILDSSKNPSELKLFKWFEHLGFFPQLLENNDTNHHSPPNQFFEFSTSSPIHRLDLAAVEATKMIDLCASLLQRIEDAKVDGIIQEQKLTELSQQDSQMSALQEYRKFAGERKAIENWMAVELSISSIMALASKFSW